MRAAMRRGLLSLYVIPNEVRDLGFAALAKT
jgi:hypothetical protein